MIASKFAEVLGNDGAAKAYRKKRLMIDHGNHVHASSNFVDSYLRERSLVVLSDSHFLSQYAACYDNS